MEEEYKTIAQRLFESGYLSCSPAIMEADDVMSLVCDSDETLPGNVTIEETVNGAPSQLEHEMVRLTAKAAEECCAALVQFGYEADTFDTGFLIAGNESTQYFLIDTKNEEQIVASSTEIETDALHYCAHMIGARDCMRITYMYEAQKRKKATSGKRPKLSAKRRKKQDD
jgi:hypothetical protein